MGWLGNIHCKWCGENEDVHRLIFCCPLSQVIWCFIRDALDWENVPISREDFLYNWIEVANTKTQIILFWLLVGVSWTVWKQHNDIVFKEKIHVHIDCGIYRLFSFLLQWRILVP
ncbi:hypothetical protein GUJ93_ZPchr0002g23589 [Zizania palustris]|uniref:Reverse transcriptase zinc-binding domain-containing protein n=1 Tax=Zizania palustris TaxID=103762 RepID=A0A8J5S0C5_ZIZPA|nr:hypothetical protein GUJ93_ZPchr0002g23589 [Zizania palustris]